MKNIKPILIVMGTMIVLSLTTSSCKKDEPYVKPQLSFDLSEQTLKESAGTVAVSVKLDKAASKDVTITYSHNGTAVEKSDATTDKPYFDYEDLNAGSVTITKGETTASIQLKLYSDFLYERDETIELTIDNVDYDKIEISSGKTQTITLKQEDGLLVILSWGPSSTETYADVDMDLFLWAPNLGETQLTNINSSAPGFDPPEGFIIPNIVKDGTYGVSCVYYEGTVTEMNFELTFVNIVDNAETGSITKDGTYSLANINKWNDASTGTKPILVETFTKTGTDYGAFSEISIPSTGSRIGSFQTPAGLSRYKYSLNDNDALKQFLK